jgi:hypothetical protein
MKRDPWKAVPALAILCCGLAPLYTVAQQSARITTPVHSSLAESAADSNTAASSKDSEATPATTSDSASSSVDPSPAPVSAPASVSVPAARDARSPPAAAETETTKSAPFGWFDQTWLNDGGHNVDSPMSTKYFTPEIRFDANYILDYNHPEDDSMVGSTEMYRSDEFQLEQASFGGDFRIQNTRGRILTMNGLFSQATVRNDASYNRGQWDLKDAYKYFSEAWGGYHWDVGHGLNVDAGIFVSYVGLFSYYNFDNWAYQPSYVSSNTPWFFNGLRIQYFPTDKLKIEPWIINGWQSYARYNGHGGLGGQILWRPNKSGTSTSTTTAWVKTMPASPDVRVSTPTTACRTRSTTTRRTSSTSWAWTLTGDAGCEYGGGPVSFAVTGQTGAVDPTGSPR